MIIIVRHGQSEWNKLNLFTGFKDIDLTKVGIHEAEKSAEKLKDFKIDLAFTSLLKRAINTCDIISEASNSDYKTIKSEELNERDYGDITGKNKKEMAKIHGEELVHKWRRSLDVRPPNGENLLDVIDRVKRYFDNNIKYKIEKNKNILIVAHGNSIRALLVV